MIKKASLLTACSVTAFSAWAQDTSPDTLVVTANRFEQPRSTVLAPTTVVTRQDIDRWQSTSVNDVLRRLPGVDITQNGGSGQLSSIFIRGTINSGARPTDIFNTLDKRNRELAKVGRTTHPRQIQAYAIN